MASVVPGMPTALAKQVGKCYDCSRVSNRQVRHPLHPLPHAARRLAHALPVWLNATFRAGGAAMTTPQIPPRAYTVRQAAQALACSPATIYRLLQAGSLRAVHLNKSVRIPAHEIDAFISRLEEEQWDEPAERRTR